MNKRQGIIATIFFFAYIFLGGWLFMVIENDTEPELPPNTSVNTEYLQTLQDIHSEYLIQNPLNLTEAELENVYRHIGMVHKGLVEKGTATGNQTSTPPYYVPYDESVFFCMIMITTIGYGNTSPKTSAGRLFCIFYSLVGIPLMGILLAALGNYFSSKLLKAHEKSKTRHYNSRIALAVNTIIYLIPGFALCIFLPAGIFMVIEDWTFIDGLYYSFITLFTIGFGDFVAGSNTTEQYKWVHKLGLMVWIFFGMGYLSMILNFIAKAMKSKKLRSLEKSVANSLKQTQERVNKEMEYFLKAMNAFYDKKIKAKGDLADMHRSSSCPSLSGMTDAELAAEVSKRRHGSKQAEDSVNFIFDLAMALACGPNLEEDQTAASNDNNNNSANQVPNLDRRRSSLPMNLERRRSSIAQLLSLALMPQMNGDCVSSKSEMGLHEVLAHFDAIRAPSFVLPFGDVVETDNETLSDDTNSVDGDNNQTVANCDMVNDSIIEMPDDRAASQEDETQVSKL